MSFSSSVISAESMTFENGCPAVTFRTASLTNTFAIGPTAFARHFVQPVRTAELAASATATPDAESVDEPPKPDQLRPLPATSVALPWALLAPPDAPDVDAANAAGEFADAPCDATGIWFMLPPNAAAGNVPP